MNLKKKSFFSQYLAVMTIKGEKNQWEKSCDGQLHNLCHPVHRHDQDTVRTAGLLVQ